MKPWGSTNFASSPVRPSLFGSLRAKGERTCFGWRSTWFILDPAVELCDYERAIKTPCMNRKMTRAQGEGSHARGCGHPGVPDFLDSRLKHAGMTEGTMVNCGIRVYPVDLGDMHIMFGLER